MPFRYTSDASEQARARVREAASVIVSNKLSLMENHLQGRSFFVSEGLSIVDGYAVPMLCWAGLMLPGGRSRWPAVEAFYQHMLLNAGVQAAMRVHGIDP